MNAEKNLSNLIANMQPKLNNGEYVFVTLPPHQVPKNITPIGQFSEKEGTTLILEKSTADQNEYSYDYIASWITLDVHSSLSAVGFTAAISSELAKHGISCNVIAAYYHDHLFVDKKDGQNALEILRNMTIS